MITDCIKELPKQQRVLTVSEEGKKVPGSDPVSPSDNW